MSLKSTEVFWENFTEKNYNRGKEIKQWQETEDLNTSNDYRTMLIKSTCNAWFCSEWS